MILNRTSLFLGLVALFCISSNAEIVELTDDNFEHQTQASTGATTGSWFIMVSSPTCSSCAELKEAFEPLDGDSELYEQGIVLGQMDAYSNSDTLTRFDILKLPTLMYIHKGTVYRFPMSEHEYRTTEVLKTFLLSDYKKVEAETIPGPPSIWTQIEAAFADVVRISSGLNGMVGVAIVGLLGLMLLTTGVLIAVLVKGNKKKAPPAAVTPPLSKKKAASKKGKKKE
jgi:thioredoxin domain-containing protein 5